MLPSSNAKSQATTVGILLNMNLALNYFCLITVSKTLQNYGVLSYAFDLVKMAASFGSAKTIIGHRYYFNNHAKKYNDG